MNPEDVIHEEQTAPVANNFEEVSKEAEAND